MLRFTTHRFQLILLSQGETCLYNLRLWSYHSWAYKSFDQERAAFSFQITKWSTGCTTKCEAGNIFVLHCWSNNISQATILLLVHFFHLSYLKIIYFHVKLKKTISGQDFCLSFHNNNIESLLQWICPDFSASWERCIWPWFQYFLVQTYASLNSSLALIQPEKSNG